ncbi:Xanthine and CO dehydrogenase maturation factor, XdhC/CoxF family [Hymenobacter daecheongensis DSM 21074]|uniref:Xanthine and CO dehydrogenase maturation factor, XdhC/CoxF family n=1 Tax=Hymenobacter daecheongensis DSM 21074 TaxID=1121955 RepID=A0A1M6EUK0_9BACT|nr:XdhC/CoxI family protein [Hymenobacter daecheongensis]SHI89165.1 Xanthine and CO dehydrogenase maturation factor, XdhC/CoxF family [Hymenobacter daecheongensis DSM 21074]
MTELQRLLCAYDAHRAAGRACALASVVDVAGSAYRRPGARMLVTDDGQLTGAISGGCLEGDARRRARQTIRQSRPSLVTYDSTDPDDDLQFGAALGCQGVVQILLEPLDCSDPDNPLELLRRWTEGVAEPAVVATVFSLAGSAAPAQMGQRLLLTADGQVQGSLSASSALHATILADARAALQAGQPATCHYAAGAGTVRVCLEILRPPVRLTVYGAGNDVQPLVRLAAGLGWRVRVQDGRPGQAQPARFPEAEAVRVVPLAQVPYEPHDGSFTLLMTHNYYYDLAVLQHLLHAPGSYIGLLGPRKKYERLLLDLEKAIPDAARLLAGRLHSPIGLNLGAETPEEIALSIVAEIQAVLTARPAGFLRDSPHPIHPPLRSDGPLVAEERTSAVCALNSGVE